MFSVDVQGIILSGLGSNAQTPLRQPAVSVAPSSAPSTGNGKVLVGSSPEPTPVQEPGARGV